MPRVARSRRDVHASIGGGPARRLALGAIGLSWLLGTARMASAGVETLTYSVGEPGTPFHAVFSWTVTGVVDRGTFLDGTPWITVEPGANLIAVSPDSRWRATGSGFVVVVDGSTVNPRMMHRVDPETLEPIGNGLQKFDSRRIFLAPPTNQNSLDATFDAEANVGMVDPATGTIAPVPLQAGDVVVTARSEWKSDGLPHWTMAGAIPHVSEYRRTAIDRYGVLTVLSKPVPVNEPHFRPPLQWPEGREAERPAPIPLSEVIDDESALLHERPQVSNGLELLLEGPTFHEGHGVLYQSAHAQHAMSADPSRQRSIVYGGNLATGVFRPMLLAATDLTADPDSRVRSRNRLIQYGIDAFGATMYLGTTSAGAGQRAAELKPWVMLAGWWLDRQEMRNPYQAIRDQYAGTAVAALDDISIGRLLFHDDYVARQVVAGLGLGGPYHQQWGPGLAHWVTSAGEVPQARLVGSETVTGRFGHLDISGANPHPFVHARNPDTYHGCLLRIESGPGAGPTVYQVLEVGDANGAIGEFITVDRPWQHGMPGPGSMVRMFPFRNGDHAPGLVSDIGRWYYSTLGHRGNVSVDCFSPAANGYAKTSYRALLVPYAALKRLADVTGDQDFLRGSTWHWLAEAVGGSGNSLVTGEMFGETPNAERITNQIWFTFRQSALSTQQRPVVREWVSGDGTASGGNGGFGQIDRTRIIGTTFVPMLPVPAPCRTDETVGFGIDRVRIEGGRSEEVGWFGTFHSTMRLGFECPIDGIVEVSLRPMNRFLPTLAASSGCDFLSPLDVAVGRRADPLGEIRVLFDGERGRNYIILVGSLYPDDLIKAEIEIAPIGEPPDGEDEDGSAGDDGDDGEP